MALQVHPLDKVLELEGTRRSAIPYLGYVEVNLQIPGIRGYNEDILLLVILTMTYAEKVPVMVGFKIIDREMGMITRGELAKATVTWRQAHSGVVMSGSLQACKGEGGSTDLATPLQPPTPLCLRNFAWMTSRGMSIPHGGSPFLHLEL